MYGDVGEIRPDTLAAFHEAEIVAVHVRTAPVFQMSLPCHTFDFNDINFISFHVEKGMDTFGAPKGNVVLSVCFCLFHIPVRGVTAPPFQ